MLTIDDKRTTPHLCRSTIDVLTCQTPLAKTFLYNTGGAGMRTGLVVVVDDTPESLVGIAAANNPCT